jgi:guanine deaminase
MAMTDEALMRTAIAKTREGIAAGQSPFGSVIARDGAVVAAAHNMVWQTCDPTAHAEVTCIRAAAAALKSIALTGCTLYSTTEPCPMCLAAIHWAKIDRVVFGATIADAAAAGFAELFVPAATLAEMGRSPLVVRPGLLQAECAALFVEWKAAGKSQAY